MSGNGIDTVTAEDEDLAIYEELLIETIETIETICRNFLNTTHL
jgi:hypothetical protein